MQAGFSGIMKYSFIIIGNDNEQSELLRQCLESFRRYSCLEILSNHLTLTKSLIKLKPQLVFIHISSLVKNTDFSFDSVNELYQYLDIIPYFVALSDTPQYAIQAIQSGFSDYLLTPLNWHNLGKCLFKFEKRVPKPSTDSISIKSYSDYQFINLQDVIYLKADNNSTDFKLQNGKTVTAFKTLKYFEQNLPFYFLRIHKSYIVNIHYVSRVHFSKLKCYLNYNEILPFSASYKSNIDYITQKLKL